MSLMAANRRLSERVASRFPHTMNTISDNYPAIVARHAQNGATIVDVGGVRSVLSPPSAGGRASLRSTFPRRNWTRTWTSRIAELQM